LACNAYYHLNAQARKIMNKLLKM